MNKNVVPNYLKDKKLSFTFEDNKTVLNVVSKDNNGKRTVERFTARCHPDDKFDALAGMRVALDKAIRHLDDEIRPGDIVEVTLPGHTYPAHVNWIKNHCNFEEAAQWRYNMIAQKGTVCRVIKIHPSNNSAYCFYQIAFVEDIVHKGMYMIEVSGLRKVVTPND